MAYLMDFLESLSSEAQKKKALASPEFKEWKELREDCAVMYEKGYFTGKGSDPEHLALMKEGRLFNAIWKRYQYVPKKMRYSALGHKDYRDKIVFHKRYIAEKMHKFFDLPRVKLADLRTAATNLSYMILPTCYIDKVVLNNIVKKELQFNLCSWNSVDIVQEIEDGERMLADIVDFIEQDLYVLCPVSLYSLYQVEQDEEKREVFFGGELLRVKTLLDTIARIQSDLFAILNGESGSRLWEVGEGGVCSEETLMHIKILVSTIIPIQRSLLEMLEISRESDGRQAWEKAMRSKHCAEVSEMLHRMSKEVSWLKEAEQALRESYVEEIEDPKKASRTISEAAAMTDILIFTLPRGTSLMYGDGFARIYKNFGVDLSESFYLNRGFLKQDKGDDEYNAYDEDSEDDEYDEYEEDDITRTSKIELSF